MTAPLTPGAGTDPEVAVLDVLEDALVQIDRTAKRVLAALREAGYVVVRAGDVADALAHVRGDADPKAAGRLIEALGRTS